MLQAGWKTTHRTLLAATTATSVGAILAMLADTIIPEAFETAHDFAELITVAGFLTAFVVSKLDR
jgi:ZIP family zinc transporter